MRSRHVISLVSGIAWLLSAMSNAGAEGNPYNASLSTGIAYEKSRFPVVRIDDTAAFIVDGRKSVGDLYKNFAASLGINTPCGPVSCTGEISIETHIGQESTEFNTQFARINAGVGAPFPAGLPLLGNAIWGLQAVVEDWRVANTHFRTVTGGLLNLIWLDERQNATLLSTEFTRFKHAGENTMLDADFRLASLSHNRHIDAINADIDLQLSLSDEKNRSGEKYLDNHAVMTRASLEKQASERWRFGGALTFQKIGFGANDPMANRSRHDRYLGRELFVESTISEKLKLRGTWSDARYASSIASFENQWSSVEVSLTASF